MQHNSATKTLKGEVEAKEIHLTEIKRVGAPGVKLTLMLFPPILLEMHKYNLCGMIYKELDQKPLGN